MARVTFSIQFATNTLAQLRNGVLKEGSRLWSRRVLSQASAISREIGTMLVEIFNNTAVARSIRGGGLEDLQSHFGFSSQTANSLVDGMGELIRSSVKIITVGKNNTVIVKIRAIDKDWNKYLSLPGAEYISQPSNIAIPVLRWLLIDPNIDIGQAAYDIVFRGQDQKFDVRIKKVSRSGRAIMVSLKSLGGGRGYVLPSIVSGQAGQNFIEMTLGQHDVAKRAAIILMKRVG